MKLCNEQFQAYYMKSLKIGKIGGTILYDGDVSSSSRGVHHLPWNWRRKTRQPDDGAE
jgi:hypothetical protein